MNIDELKNLKQQFEDKKFDKIVRLDNNGKFINKDTKIEIVENGEYVVFTNSYPDGETQSLKVKLKNK